ncbi:MAG: hypothetical protein NW216_03630 [Hyphomicrobium sp.]|nr:hypothetical protein [Hyphomicrobium sp.]
MVFRRGALISTILLVMVACAFMAGGAQLAAQIADQMDAPIGDATPTEPSGAGSGPVPSAGGTCAKTDFEVAVDGAAETLRELNQKNKPQFQDKLRHLKDKRGWSPDQFLKEAAPFAKDAEIDAFDKKTSDLLSLITAMGEEGSASASPDCTMLATLQGHMAALVETQNAKWAYMFQKIDAELAK